MSITSSAKFRVSFLKSLDKKGILPQVVTFQLWTQPAIRGKFPDSVIVTVSGGSNNLWSNERRPNGFFRIDESKKKCSGI